MSNIIIKNSTVNIYTEDNISKVKDELLTKLYYARNKDTMGGYKAWLRLLDMYFIGDYIGMYQFIKSCHGKGGRTRNECIQKLNIIIGGTSK